MASGVDHAALARQLTLERGPLLDRIGEALGCDRTTSSRGLVETLRFLDLAAGSARPLAPPKRIDLVWHELILDTRAYARLCGEIFGRFLHHTPRDDDDDDNRRRLEVTLAAHRARFGAPDPFWWRGMPEPGPCGACDADPSMT